MLSTATQPLPPCTDLALQRNQTARKPWGRAPVVRADRFDMHLLYCSRILRDREYRDDDMPRVLNVKKYQGDTWTANNFVRMFIGTSCQAAAADRGKVGAGKQPPSHVATCPPPPRGSSGSARIGYLDADWEEIRWRPNSCYVSAREWEIV